MKEVQIDEITPREMLGKLVYLPVQVFGVVANEDGIGVKAHTLTSAGEIIEEVQFLYDPDARVYLSNEDAPVRYEELEGEENEDDYDDR